MKKVPDKTRIRELLKELRLPAMREHFEHLAEEALAEQSDPQTFLRELLELEVSQRRTVSIASAYLRIY